jgi:hypothetical protein
MAKAYFEKVSYISLDYPGAITSSANGINNSGQIVMGYQTANGAGDFLTDGDTMLGVAYLPLAKLVRNYQEL